MEPNNIEQQFRDKLNTREIKPSEHAWDRLDAMLSVAEKPKRSYSWLYIAASFLGFIFIAGVFFSQTEEMTDIKHNETVFTPKTDGPAETPGSQPVIETETASNMAIVQNNQSIKNYPARKPKINQSKPGRPEIHSTAPRLSPERQDTGLANLAAENTIINQKSEQKETVRKPAYVNVDELLASVDKPEKKQLFNRKSGVDVNAGNLLSQVDGELELSFRERVIKTVNKNYQTVKVALANRNNE